MRGRDLAKTESVTALDLPMVDPLPEDTAKYFAICEEKLGLVPEFIAGSWLVHSR